jgi:hypothetical protein
MTIFLLARRGSDDRGRNGRARIGSNLSASKRVKLLCDCLKRHVGIAILKCSLHVLKERDLLGLKTRNGRLKVSETLSCHLFQPFDSASKRLVLPPDCWQQFPVWGQN